MLIMNDEHLHRAGAFRLDEQCKYCSKELAASPLIMSDDAEQTVYHAACAVELAGDIMADMYNFLRPPAPYTRFFVLSVLETTPIQNKETSLDRV